MEETVIAYKVKFNYYFMLSAIYLILFGFMTWCSVYTMRLKEEAWIVALCWLFAAYILAFLAVALVFGILIARSPQVLILRKGDTLRCYVWRIGWCDIPLSEIASLGEIHDRAGNGGTLRSGTLRILLRSGRKVKVRGIKNVSSVRDEILMSKVRQETASEKN